MTPQKTKNLLRVLCVIVALIAGLYLLGVIGAFVFQRDLLYMAARVSPGTPAENGVPEMREISIRTTDNLDLVSWFVPPKSKGGKIVVMFHGNCCDLARHGAAKSTYFSRKGYGVLLPEYRGFAMNKGKPDEEGLYNDARANIEWLLGEGYKTDQIVLFGNSLGTGVAVQMAGEFKTKYLILESPYTSVVDIGKYRYPFLPVQELMWDKFDSLSKISNIKPALLIVHGDMDTIVPIEYGRRLFAAANEPKEFIIIPGGRHGGLVKEKAFDKMVAWLDRQVDKENKRK